jgi:hypothetical protein
VPIPCGSPLLRLFTSIEESLQVATSPCCHQDLLDVILRVFPWLLGPLPRRSHRVHVPVNFPDVIGLPLGRLGRLPALVHDATFRGNDFRGCRHSIMLPGRTMARTGLRMMPTSPSSPLKSRTVSFPQYGFKAGISDSAFPSTTRCSRRMVCSRPSCTSLPVALYPGSETGNAVRWYATVQAVDSALPQGPSLRSGL